MFRDAGVPLIIQQAVQLVRIGRTRQILVQRGNYRDTGVSLAASREVIVHHVKELIRIAIAVAMLHFERKSIGITQPVFCQFPSAP